MSRPRPGVLPVKSARNDRIITGIVGAIILALLGYYSFSDDGSEDYSEPQSTPVEDV